ncbi:MAG: hypothetical protein PHI37_04090 [Candidatus Gracilibacteria bacterium]|nr:hypothetical protein [Candidatus Gracilibacteria bacterium]
MGNILTIGPIRELDFLLNFFGIDIDVTDNIADIGSGSSNFPETLVSKGVLNVYAVDRTYIDIDYFSKIVKTSIDVLLSSLGKNRHLLEEYEIDNINRRILLLRDSPRIVFSRNKVINLTDINDLPENFFDKLFLSNMLLGVEDIGNFLLILGSKLNQNGQIFISEYSGNVDKINYLKSLISQGVEYKGEYDGVSYFIIKKIFFGLKDKKD